MTPPGPVTTYNGGTDGSRGAGTGAGNHEIIGLYALLLRHRSLWPVVLIGCALSLGLFWLLQRQLDSHHRLEFDWVARERIRTLVHEVHKLFDAAESVSDLYRVDPQMTAKGFRTVAQSVISRSSGIQALAWLTPGTDGDGFLVCHMEPALEGLPVPGARVASDDGIGRILARARDQGSPALSGHLIGAQALRDGSGVMLAMPVYGQEGPPATEKERRRALAGLNLAFFRLDDLTREAIGLLEPRGIEVAVVDQQAPVGERLLVFYPSRLDPGPPPRETEIGLWLGSHSRSTSRQVPVADRIWTLYAGATATFRSAEAFYYGPRFALGAGLLFTALLTLYLVRMRENLLARQRLNQAVQAREALFRQLAEAIDGVLWAVQPDWRRFLYLSPACERIIGVPAEALYEHLGPLKALTSRKDWWRLRSMILQIRRSGRGSEVDFRVRREGKPVRWFRARGFPVFEGSAAVTRVVGVAEDITARHLAERALRRSAERLRGLFNQFPDILMTVDRDARILTLSRGLKGLPPGRTTGRDSCALVPEEFRDWYRATLARTFDSGEIGHFRYSAEDATWWEIRTVPVHQRKRVEGALVIASDVTAQQNLQDQAARSARLASLGVLAAGIAHEVNNPNSTILFNAKLLGRAWRDALPVLGAYRSEYGDFLLAGIPFDEAAQTLGRLIEDMAGNAERIGRIIQNLKRLARQDDEGRSERVKIDAVLHDAAMVLNHPIHCHTDAFHLDVPEGLPPVLGSFQQLEQVFVNIILNALQALPDRGRAVCVRARAHPAQQEISVEVADEGVGVADAVKHRLTEPFFTTRGDIGGTGLGLSISKTILERHGGRIDIESVPERGTLVTVTLPVAAEATP